MSRQQQLNSYIQSLLRRLRLHAWWMGLAIVISTALLTTIALVFILNHYAFPETGLRTARAILFVSIVAIIAMALFRPLFQLDAQQAVRKVESTHSELQQRLTTFHERQREGDPFLELLAADTLSHTYNAPVTSVVPNGSMHVFAGFGLGCLATLTWLIVARPGFMGYGASLLWTGHHKAEAPLYSLEVSPGNATIRRNSDQIIAAHLRGLQPQKVQLFAHYQSSKGWEPINMQQNPEMPRGTDYQFVLTGLPENVEYYVSAGPLMSPHYTVRVADLPSIKSIRVTYHYPRWTGLPSSTQEQSGDLRAIEGTEASIEIQTDKPLSEGQLLLDDNKALPLTSEAPDKYKGLIRMDRDGAYHIAAVDQGQPVRISEDYFIGTDKAEPPEISINRPGGDYRASPIEEVTVGVRAKGQFEIKDLHLHYSVNGGADHDINLTTRPDREIAGSHTINLEDFKLVPGDLVSLYATAKDGHTVARTNISFVQIDPFEREFSQSQQSGGSGGPGGGQNNQTDMSKREKELIAATWKQQNERSPNPKEIASNAQFLSEAQQKLRDQVLALSARMQSRDLSSANEELNSFDKDMEQAAEAMAPSVEKLKEMQWKDALPLEQKALQALLRAEATYRKIQVAFGQQGGGGGAASSAGRDLASLFDLELDTEKNQYETAQSTSPAEQQQKEIDDVLAKLDALAKRQEEIANQESKTQQRFQERWQQEMLRREAEKLQRQMEQLAQKGEMQQQTSGQRSSGSSQSSTGQANQSPSTSSSLSKSNVPPNRSSIRQEQRIEQALSRLREASEMMKRGTSPQSNSSDAAQQAAKRLDEARDLMSDRQQQMVSQKLSDLSQEADRIAEEERAQNNKINQFSKHRSPDVTSRDSMEERIRERNQLAADRQTLSDELSRLQSQMRNSARSVAPNQPEATQKLRQALSDMDESDLDNRVQRTADWLRRGIDPNSNGTESEIANGLQKLSQQLHAAQAAVTHHSRSKDGPAGTGSQTAALDQLRRLRAQLETLSHRSDDVNHSNRDSANDPRDKGTQSSSSGQAPADQAMRAGQLAGRDTNQPLSSRGSNRLDRGGNVRSGGGASDGTALGNLNTGNNTYGGAPSRPAPTDASQNPADAEKNYRQQLNALGQLGQVVQTDPALSREVRDLTRQLQGLDPRRFPGNPALIEQMHNEVLGAIDRIELQLLNKTSTTEARSGKPMTTPDGYQDAVADYYRRLSSSH